MRIVVQDPISKAYFDGERWGESLEQAMDFDTTRDAEKYCLGRKLSTALVVVKFSGDQSDVCFPVGVRDSLLFASAAAPAPSGAGPR